MKALIMSGGGAKGAFTVGALQYLHEQHLLDDLDIISGTSTGSLIAAMYCADKLDDVVIEYSTTQKGDIIFYQNIIENIRRKKAFVFSTEPLRKKIADNISEGVFQTIKNSKTELYLTATNLQTGMPTVFCTKPLPSVPGSFDTILLSKREDLLSALEASSNQGVMMPPVRIGPPGKKVQYIDGGHREVVPTRIVDHRIRNAQVRDHTIYVLSNNPKKLAEVKEHYDDAIPMLMRVLSIFVHDVRENDLAVLDRLEKEFKADVVCISPGSDIDESFTTGLRFNAQLMLEWISKGRNTAKRIINARKARMA